jgi:polyferredoxin
MNTGRKLVIARRAVQYSLLIVFIALFVWSRRGGWPGELVSLPMRLDPLAMITATVAGRTFIAGSFLALVTLALTFAVGRGWCGWVCPLGACLDLLSFDRWRRKERVPREIWRKAKHILLLVTLFAALLSGLTLLIFDPLALLFRGLTVVAWPALDAAVSAAEHALYQVSFLQEAVSGFDQWTRPRLLPPEPAFYRETWLFAALLAAVFLANLATRRFWCRYLCPLGALLGLVSKLGLLRRQVNERCTKCGLCAKACPTSTIDPARDFASDPAECTVCLECVAACPAGANNFARAKAPSAWREYDPGKRSSLAALGVAAAGMAVLKSDILVKREHPHLIQPPGARDNALLAKCVRCAECMRACPTSGLQPALAEAGLEGLWTPVLVPRIGYCDHSCNACGQVCPTGAIPKLDLAEKNRQVLGAAYINTDHCLPWANHQNCGVCEEQCPVSPKAILLEPTFERDVLGRATSILRPYVLRERCIGCGICEYACPVGGEAAIRVWSVSATT